MKKIVFITLSLLLALSFWNCEKDDICAEGSAVTPRVIIEFYDATATEIQKNVTNLGVIEPTFSSGFAFTAVSKIQVPLQTNANTTTLNFIQNGSDTDTTNDNIDAITFNYDTKDIYISRACGYKTIFTMNSISPTVFPASEYWIKNIVVSQSNIENENEVHVKIYF